MRQIFFGPTTGFLFSQLQIDEGAVGLYSQELSLRFEGFSELLYVMANILEQDTLFGKEPNKATISEKSGALPGYTRIISLSEGPGSLSSNDIPTPII